MIWCNATLLVVFYKNNINRPIVQGHMTYKSITLTPGAGLDASERRRGGPGPPPSWHLGNSMATDICEREQRGGPESGAPCLFDLK